MKFKVGDKVEVKGLEGVVIAVFYHRVQVSFGSRYGVWVLKKKEVSIL